MASFTFLIPINLIPSISCNPNLDASGKMQTSNPSFYASNTRWSAILTALTSPLKPTSPKQIVRTSIGFSL